MPRNVSFASNDSDAYREHNPPAVLRKQEAARREMSPMPECMPEGTPLHRTVSAGTSSSLSFSDAASVPGVPPPPPGSQPRASQTILMSPGASDTKSAFEKITSPQLLPFPQAQQQAQAQQQFQQQFQQQYQQQYQQPFQQQQQQAQQAQSQAQTQSQVQPPHFQLPQAQFQAQQQPAAAQAAEDEQGQLGAGKLRSGTPARAALKSRSRSLSLDESSQNEHKSEEVHILVAVTGSVATIKLPQIIHKLKEIYREKAIVQVVVTRASKIFFDAADLPRGVKIWYDSDEWRSRQPAATQPAATHPSLMQPLQQQQHSSAELSRHCDQQLHIQLRRWADILLVAPCSANTLAKFAYGICDNLLTSIFRVWNPEVPIILAPAMNMHMYTNPVTKMHFNIMKQSFPSVEILLPVEKVLVCGDIGMGGMREWMDIVQVLVKRIGVQLDYEEDEDEDEDEDEVEDEDEDDDQAFRTADDEEGESS